jgi:hypothetical protein
MAGEAKIKKTVITTDSWMTQNKPIPQTPG